MFSWFQRNCSFSCSFYNHVNNVIASGIFQHSVQCKHKIMPYLSTSLQHSCHAECAGSVMKVGSDHDLLVAGPMPSLQSATDVTRLVALLAKMAFWPLRIANARQLTEQSLTRQKRLEWQSSKLAPFGTKHELILSLRSCNVKIHVLNHLRGAIADLGNSLAKLCSALIIPLKRCQLASVSQLTLAKQSTSNRRQPPPLAWQLS